MGTYCGMDSQVDYRHPFEKWRKEQDLTVDEVCELIGAKSRNTYYRYINGRVPRAVTILTIERVTKHQVTRDHFLDAT